MSAANDRFGEQELSDPYAWVPFAPSDVAELLAGTDVPWCVTAGWAVDLFLGRPTRAHSDIEIAIPSARWPDIRRRLSALDFVVAGDGRLWPLTPSNLAEHFQTWGRDNDGAYRIDVFRDPHDGGVWICRHDSAIRRPYSQLIRTTEDGIPFMSPEVTLFFKAQRARVKDMADLTACLPALAADELSWLRDAVANAHPGHEWLSLLD